MEGRIAWTGGGAGGKSSSKLSAVLAALGAFRVWLFALTTPASSVAGVALAPAAVEAVLALMFEIVVTLAKVETLAMLESRGAAGVADFGAILPYRENDSSAYV